MSHSFITVTMLLIASVIGDDDEVPLALKLCTDWEIGSDAAMETYLKQFHLTEIGKYVQSHGNISNTNWYLPQLLIDYHLSKFRLNGASFVGAADILLSTNYGRTAHIGSTAQTVTTYPEMHELLMNCSKAVDPKQCLAATLEMDAFDEAQALMVYNVNETYLEYLNVRMANESQRNIAGYTTQNVQIRQAVIDSVAAPMFCYEPITDANGTFCYPSCNAPVCGMNANCNKAYCGNYVVQSSQPKYAFYFDFLHANDYCVPSTDIIMKTDAANGDGCNEDKQPLQEFMNYGTLAGFGAGLITAFVSLCLLKLCGFRCKKMETNFIADQLMRDGDSHYLL